ncbi:MAG: hypothetical protein JWQ87_5448 [Candidatus Sulfotelmatobacter sp.]|nr:hypothetical protein [Candidatus Sulfotelmatobacter sp.]
MAPGTSAIAAITPPPGFQLDGQAPPQGVAPPQAQAQSGITPPPGFQLESQPAQAQPTRPDDMLSKAEDAIGKVGHVAAAAYNDIGQSAQGLSDFVNHLVGYGASENAKTELARGWSALKSGGVAEAQLHLRKASEDIVANHPLSQMLTEQWDSSARNKQAVEEDMKKGDHLAVVQHAAGILPIANIVSDAFDKAIKEPTAENVTHAAITGAMALSPAIIRGVNALPEAAEGAEAAETTPAEAVKAEPKPGFVQNVRKGKEVAQPQAQGALRSAGESISKETGATTVAPKSLRETLTDPINANEEQAQELYKQIDEAAGTDFKGLGAKLKNTNRALSQSVDSTEEAKLAERRDNIEATIEQAKQTAREKGIDPAVIDQADAHFKRMSALSDVEAKVFKNPSIVSGNVAHGTEETVNIDSAIKALQKLQDSEAYGAPRLEQAFGKEGAKQLLDHMYSSQRQGVHAMKVQKVVKWLAAAAGASVTVKGGASLLSGGH